MHGLGDAVMKKDDPRSGHQGPIERYARGDYSPFVEMFGDVDKWLGRSNPEWAARIFQLLLLAERDFLKSNMRNALFWTWTAGEVFGALASRPAAGKILQKQTKARHVGRKATVKFAWNRAFYTHKPFRRWEARDQAEYLTANHEADVAGITPETLTKYVREFRKKAP